MKSRTFIPGALVAAALMFGCKSTPISPGPTLVDFVEASFAGAGQIPESRLEAVVLSELAERRSRGQVTKAEVDDAAYALELFYRGEGYPDAEVGYTYDQDRRDQDRRNGDRRTPAVGFEIEPGLRVSIRELVTQGFERVDRDELAALLAPIEVGAPFVQAQLAQAAGRIESHYLARGFLAVELEAPEFEWSDAGEAEVAFRVTEGPKYVLREASIAGAAPEVAERLDELAAGFIGRPYGSHLAFELRAAVLREHGQAGHPDCAIEVEQREDVATGDVALELAVQPGPRVTITDIAVRGNEGVPAERVRARLALEAGDAYDAQMVSRSFNQLYSTGLFETVRFDLEGEGPERTLAVQITESPSLQLFAEPGWGSYEGPRIRTGIDENNLFSSGRRARLEGWLSGLARGLELQLADPFLFGSPVTGQLSLFAQNREEPSFTVDEVGAALGFRRAWTEELSTTFGVEYQETRLSAVDINGSNIPQALIDSVDVGQLTFSLAYDTRDNVLMPTRGGLARFHSDLALDALGSNIEAFENGLDLTAALPLNERTLIAVAGRVTLIAPFGDTDVIPLQQRLFNGGENTVRSFRESRVGPTDASNDPLGGEARTLMSVELRRHLGGNVSGALFYDLGNVELDYTDYFSFRDFRHGIGFGVRYLLPIGPLRLDAAWNPDHRSNESEFVLHFAVGLPY